MIVRGCPQFSRGPGERAGQALWFGTQGWGCAGAGGETDLGIRTGVYKWGVQTFPPHLFPPTATMGCCCSSDYDEDWIENIDICEHCNYPIEPNNKRQVRRGRVDPPSQWPNASLGGPVVAKPWEDEGSQGSLSCCRS